MFRIMVRSSEKRPELHTGSEGSEFGEQIVCRPGSYFGETTGSNPGSDGSEKGQVPSLQKLCLALFSE